MADIDPYEICKFAGLTLEAFERAYSHHNPDYMAGIRKAQANQPELKIAAAAERLRSFIPPDAIGVLLRRQLVI